MDIVETEGEWALKPSENNMREKKKCFGAYGGAFFLAHGTNKKTNTGPRILSHLNLIIPIHSYGVFLYDPMESDK